MKFKDLLCFSMVYSKNSTLPKTFYQWMAYLLAGQCSCGGSRAGLRLVHACVCVCVFVAVVSVSIG